MEQIKASRTARRDKNVADVENGKKERKKRRKKLKVTDLGRRIAQVVVLPREAFKLANGKDHRPPWLFESDTQRSRVIYSR